MEGTRDEKLPLTKPGAASSAEVPKDAEESDNSRRKAVWEFLEGKGPGGVTYERFSILLIVVNVVSFVVGSVYDEQYNVNPETGVYQGPHCTWCDVVFFGNDVDNGMSGTSILEAVTAVCFTIDWCLRYWACVEDPKEYPTRFAYVISFFSIIDLISTVPFYFEICLPNVDLAATQFVRIFRLFRMMRVEGRYAEAFTLFDDVVAAKKDIMVTAGFVGAVVWVILAGFYYVTCRFSTEMIYCPRCPDVDVTKCTIDQWGLTDCTAGLTAAGCAASLQCWNLYESIPESMFQTLVNLWGEFPLADRQRGWGMVISVFVAVVAQVVFGIPCGIIGSGFEEKLKEREKEKEQSDPKIEKATTQADYNTFDGAPTGEVEGDTFREKVYRFIQGKNYAGEVFDWVIVALIVTSTLSFMVETVNSVENNPTAMMFLDGFEWITVIVFTVEYILDAYSIGADPQYEGLHGLWKYQTKFIKLIDLLAILPFYISLATGGQGLLFVRALRLVRIVKTQHFISAFNTLELVIIKSSDILIITGFAAGVFWILFSALMYFAERSNPDAEMASYYNTIPNAMWVTLLNLSSEVPLCMYTNAGKWLVGIMGIFAVGFVGIPIGVLSAEFEEETGDAAEENREEPPLADEEEQADDGHKEQIQQLLGGKTTSGYWFKRFILLLIFGSVFLAIIETVPGYECSGGVDEGSTVCAAFDGLEAFSVIVFTIEYLLGFYVAPSKFDFFFSFYCLIDMLAIVPWYISLIFPGGWVDQQSTLFLMLRILRLLKLDKEFPSLTLIDDVFREKKPVLMVTGIIAGIGWILLGSLMYMAEKDDTFDIIDPIPLLGCSGDDCTESIRYSNVFDSLAYINMHLFQGDYPIIEYNMWGRTVCFFAVVLAAGIIAIPGGVISSGFQDKMKEGDSFMRDFDKQVDQLWQESEGEQPEGTVEKLQVDVNTFLNGEGKKGKRTFASKLMNQALLVAIIVSVCCVLMESLPRIDRAVGNGSGNIFDLLELLCVFLFTAEYGLRLFSVTKDKNHLNSRWVYCTTFFGIVDFLTIAPFYVATIAWFCGADITTDATDAFRLIRLFRLLELEHFFTAFTLLDNVFVRSKDALIATGVLFVVIWLSASALFFIFEQDNPQWCTAWVDPICETKWTPDCVCAASSTFDTMPHALYYVSIFLAGEWAVCDFTIPGKILCVALDIVAIGLAALPVGIFFDSFSAVLDAGGDLAEADAALEEGDGED